MFSNLDQVKIISSFNKTTKQYGKIQNRAYHGFIFRISGSVKYDFENESITVNEGDIIFLPQNSSYEYKTLTQDDNYYTSINFEADIINAKPTVYQLEDYQHKNFILHHFSKTWKFANTPEKLDCLSIFYSFLSHLSAIENLKNKKGNKYFLIEPAIEFLKNKIYDSSLKVDKLHLLCGVSNTYFRSIFKRIYNMGPQEYLISNRLSHANLIIKSGDFDNIYEVAESVGFSDPLYFSKAYKKRFGYSPSKTIE